MVITALLTAALLALAGCAGSRAQELEAPEVAEAEAPVEAVAPEGEAALASPAPAASPARPADPPLGAGDVVYVELLRHGDMTRTLTIPASGVIFFPLVGEIDTTGMTTAGLREVLTARLNEVLVDPQVSVERTEVRSQNYLVLGEVFRPGQYAAATATTALEAVGRAGGFLRTATQRNVVLIRKQPDGSATAQIIDLRIALRDADMSDNVTLSTGDILYVPPSAWTQVDRFATHVTTWLQPILGTESAILLGDELYTRFDNGSTGRIDTSITINPVTPTP